MITDTSYLHYYLFFSVSIIMLCYYNYYIIIYFVSIQCPFTK